ncbi:MAG: hypothetical protein ACQEQS_05970 [Thermodesulfobacteriota bacterium]
MKHTIIISFFTLFFLNLQICSVSASEEVTFNFRPENKTVMIENTEAVKKEIVNKETIKSEKSVVETRVIYNKTQNGFNLVVQPLDIKFKLDNEPVENPVFDILKESPVIYKIDEKGKFQGLSGYDEIKKLFYENFTEEFASQISRIFNKEKMEQKAEFEWAQKTGSYAGKTVTHKEKWERKEKLNFEQTDPVSFNVVTRFFLNEKFNKKDCVKIVINYENEDDKRPFIKGNAVVYTDPDTMNIYSQTMERTLYFNKKTDKGEDIPAKIYEKREYDYEYRFSGAE